MSEPYDPENLLDRLSDRQTLELHYAHVKERERTLLARRLPLRGTDVLSVGAGWTVGRHLFPKGRFRLTAVDVDPTMVHLAIERGEADEALVASAGELPFEPESFDVVLYRLALHHVAYQRPLGPVFEEAARLLRPGGTMVALEPGILHPVGAGLALANRLGLSRRIHGTVDDLPLSARSLRRNARAAGLVPEIHAVTYAWRRLPRPVQRAIYPLDRLGSLPILRDLGHHLLLLAGRPPIHS
ncbi:MAG TPA: class I SAM-dependent methyltransferase [Thermoleophilaceae bacterium]|nr:class I SAM-dependent methyltransferase [Thermoleophilaceae bacterium]